MNKIISIKLLSDLCSGSGESNGSFIDTDVCFDSYGFPYIPAKRIKGVLKEAALELKEFCDEPIADKMDCLFGIEGKESAKFRIHDGRIKNYRFIVDEFEHIETNYKSFIKPQYVANYYTNIRSNTTIDDENGTAKDGSLRSTRVVNANNVFECNVELIDDDLEDLLDKCCKMVRHMGIKRTRGLGEVKLTLLSEKSLEDIKQTKVVFDDETEYKVKYHAYSESALMMTNGKSLDSQPYIAGSSILGFFANQYLKEHKEVDDIFRMLFLSNEVIFSNVTISDEEAKEYQPVPASFQKVKDKDIYYNAMYDIKNNEIKSSLHSGYVNIDKDNIKLIKPLTMLNYHHRRPEDKSIGHATSEDGVFYQLNSLKEGQYFLGNISGKGKYIKLLYPYLKENGYIQVGKSKNAQYGHMRILKVFEPIECKKEMIEVKDFAVVLKSPLLLLNKKNACYESNVYLLKEQLKQYLELTEETEPKLFLNFTMISGYNAKWNLAKPQCQAFDGGSVVVYHLINTITVPRYFTLGEKQQEGLGQLEVFTLNQNNGELIISNDTIKNVSKPIHYAKPLVSGLIYNCLKYEISELAMKMYKGYMDCNPTFIGRLSLMAKNSTMLNFIRNVEGIKIEDKKAQALKIIEAADEIITIPNYQLLNNFERINDDRMNDLKIQFIDELLYNIKLAKREMK